MKARGGTIIHPAATRAAVFGTSCLLTFLFSCRAAELAPSSNPGLDLMERLTPDPETLRAQPDFQRRLAVARRGRREDSLVLIAPAASRISLPGSMGRVVLEGWLTPVFNLGDGFQVEIVLAASGSRTNVFTRYFDPGRSSGSREWRPLSVPLTTPPTPWDLEIRVTGGPRGDLVGDWLAISRLRLVEVR